MALKVPGPSSACAWGFYSPNNWVHGSLHSSETASKEHEIGRPILSTFFLPFFQPLPVHGWTSASLLAVHRLCGVIEGRLSHFLPRWLRTGWQSAISQGFNPLKYSAVAGNWTRAMGRTDNELSHWAIMTDLSTLHRKIMKLRSIYMAVFFRWHLSLKEGCRNRVQPCAVTSEIEDTSTFGEWFVPMLRSVQKLWIMSSLKLSDSELIYKWMQTLLRWRSIYSTFHVNEEFQLSSHFNETFNVYLVCQILLDMVQPYFSYFFYNSDANIVTVHNRCCLTSQVSRH